MSEWKGIQDTRVAFHEYDERTGKSKKERERKSLKLYITHNLQKRSDKRYKR